MAIHRCNLLPARCWTMHREANKKNLGNPKKSVAWWRPGMAFFPSFFSVFVFWSQALCLYCCMMLINSFYNEAKKQSLSYFYVPIIPLSPCVFYSILRLQQKVSSDVRRSRQQQRQNEIYWVRLVFLNLWKISSFPCFHSLSICLLIYWTFFTESRVSIVEEAEKLYKMRTLCNVDFVSSPLLFTKQFRIR